ncbi:GlcG/HbpS family heme-binding protein [Paraburkholderia susongensis]|uniref:Uncharacterized conserved protein GlcG, DUF336 family n=1 Tax=Paraburkholderia susongensis TaxID=1515439 RepID=A0A1X7M422_9BURK|nr:heme-binding protein [Paraburkholderia susongensis]SMG60730.1 Uncharacterized conserved protein GlcG, DUF336 family [Paraburkholderia susongensis]
MEKLTLDQANEIATCALRAARENAYAPMAVVVLDDAGHVKAVQREDRATALRVDIASGKAWAAVNMGMSSRTLRQRADDNAPFFGALSAVSGGRFIPQTGAILIRSASGEILGAVGASGGSGEQDEAICIDGVVAAGLNHA